MTIEPTPAVSCRGLRRAYPTGSGTLEVLRGVDLSVAPGEVAAILGPSGSGKSTLLRLLAGLDRPDSGQIHWGGMPVHTRRPQQLTRMRARHVGLVFQQHYLLEELTAAENVSLPGRIRNERDAARELRLLELVSLADRASHLPRQLSGGEKQRIAVARALYDEPPLILADEPTGSLDRVSAEAVYRLLVELARDRGTAVLLVTHDEGLVQDVDSRYALVDGVLAQVAEAVA